MAAGTFASLYAEIQRLMGDSSTDTTTNIKSWLNLALQRLVADAEYPFLRRRGSFTTTAGTRLYTLPGDVLFPLTMRIAAQNRFLIRMSSERHEMANPDWSSVTDQSIPRLWVPDRWVGVSEQPASAEAVNVFSSDAADTTAKVTVEGVVSGEHDREVISLNGTTPVAGAKSFSEVYSISKDLLTAGRITVRGDTSGTVFLLLGALHFTERIIQVLLDPIPNAAHVVDYRYMPWVPEMVNDSDVPIIPLSDREALIFAAVMYGFMFQDQTQYERAEREYAKALGRLRSRMIDDEPTIPQFQFVGGAPRYPIIAGDYNSYLLAVFWGGA